MWVLFIPWFAFLYQARQVQDNVAFGYASIFVISLFCFHMCHQYDMVCDRVFTYLVPMMDILTMFTLIFTTCGLYFHCYNNHDDAHQDVQIQVKPPSS